MLQDTGEMGGLPYLLCSVSFIPLAGKSVISILYIVGVSDSKTARQMIILCTSERYNGP